MSEKRSTPPFNEQAYRYAVAASLATLKDTPRAVRRCRKRTKRMLDRIDAEVMPFDAPFDEVEVARAARAWIRLRCTTCRKCEGA